jgi:hypothetical protein
VLGTFSISADFQLILQALQYNAHRVGADAVVVHKLQWWDIRNWADPRTVTKTETIQPTEQEKKEYREKLKEYEAAKQQGKSVKKPTEPTQTRREEEVFVPGHWQVQGNAFPPPCRRLLGMGRRPRGLPKERENSLGSGFTPIAGPCKLAALRAAE